MLAHLGHPLVDMSARLLRAAVWSGQTGLHRVAARYRDIRRHSFPVAVIFVVPRREATR